MAIYTISDLHLSLGMNKPMDIFGDNWENHDKKIRSNWIKKVKEEDLILLPGDFSWAMYIQDAKKDFEYLNELPGTKLLLKGNHDYWWESLKRMREFLKENNFSNIDFIYNNSYIWENKIIVGTRGWSEQEENPEKIIRRENLRLELSIQDGIKKFGDDKEIIVCMHYPPFNGYESPELNFIETMKKYNIKICIYGHIHGEVGKEAKKGNIDGIKFVMASSDQTNFDLIKIA
jgi:predicted phosphohydrolase